MSYPKVEALIDNLEDKIVTQYTEYWTTMLPKTEADYFKRWLYAMLTAAMSAAAGNQLFTIAIQQFPQWENSQLFLTEAYRNARVGFFNQKASFAFALRSAYINNPEKFVRRAGEDWIAFRNRIAKATPGLGMAKGGFGVELTSPINGGAVCLDRHMLRLYGSGPAISDIEYRKLEKHWLARCELRKVPPCIARCAIWDALQGHTSSRWWSDVLNVTQADENELVLT